jgi:hypothetical protein
MSFAVLAIEQHPQNRVLMTDEVPDALALQIVGDKRSAVVTRDHRLPTGVKV